MRTVSFFTFPLKTLRRAGRVAGNAAPIPRLLVLFVALTGLWGAGALPSAQNPKPQPNSVPAIKPHDPPAGKECSACHRRATSAKTNCLIARDDLCELCHQIPVEGGVARLVETSDAVCFKCHRRDQFKGSVVHGPFAAGACITCHDPHGSAVPGMLRATGSQMCLGCHKDIRTKLSSATFRHRAAASNCLDCHAPHMSQQPFMLKSAIPELCGTCHETTVGDLQKAAVKHSATTKDAACMNCHDPHAAQQSRLLPADDMAICLKCHDQTVKDEHREFADIRKLLAANPYPHGPIQNRYCSACHNPHGSPYFRLLTGQYPQAFYAPFFITNYDLCFRCHDAELAMEERSTRATEFRDGDRNLHFVHVNKASHGRTCRACHEVHASANPNHIASTVPFGNWELPVQYKKTENGGSCAPGCHALQNYSRMPATPARQ